MSFQALHSFLSGTFMPCKRPTYDTITLLHTIWNHWPQRRLGLWLFLCLLVLTHCYQCCSPLHSSAIIAMDQLVLLALAYQVNFCQLCELALILFSFISGDYSVGDIYSGLFGRFFIPRTGRDLFHILFERPRLFWTVTGLTFDEFDSVLEGARGALLPRRRGQALTPRNKLLLFMIWMRQYPSYGLLSLLFYVNEQYVHDIIRTLLPIVSLTSYQRHVRWPTPLEWRRMPRLAGNSVGIIDGTPHLIRRPWRGNLQQLFYSGHRKTHILNNQVVVDADNYVVQCRPGFTGATTDSMSYRYASFHLLTIFTRVDAALKNICDHTLKIIWSLKIFFFHLSLCEPPKPSKDEKLKKSSFNTEQAYVWPCFARNLIPFQQCLGPKA